MICAPVFRWLFAGKRFVRREHLSPIVLLSSMVLSSCTPSSNTNVTVSPDVPASHAARSDINTRSDKKAPSVSFPAQKQTIASAASQLKFRYQLRPDHRFVSAFRIAYKDIFGKPADVFAEHVDDKWVVRCGGREAAVFGDAENFETQYESLRKWTSILIDERAMTLEPDADDTKNLSLSDPSPRSLFQKIAACEQLIKNNRRTEKVCTTHAAALAWLVAEKFDLVDLGEEIDAQALASSALCEVLTHKKMNRIRFLLADSFQYPADAKRFASSLSNNDALKELVSPQSQPSRKYESFDGYVHIKSLARFDKFDQLAHFVDTAYQNNDAMRLPVLKEIYASLQNYSRCGVLLQVLNDTELVRANLAVSKLAASTTLKWNAAQSKDSLNWLPKHHPISSRGPQISQDLVHNGASEIEEQFNSSYFCSALIALSNEYMSLDLPLSPSDVKAIADRSEFAEFAESYVTLWKKIRDTSASESEISRFLKLHAKYGALPAYKLVHDWGRENFLRPIDSNSTLFRTYLDIADSRPTNIFSACELADNPFWNVWAAEEFRDQSARLGIERGVQRSAEHADDPMKNVHNFALSLNDKLRYLDFCARMKGRSPVLEQCYSEMTKLYPNSVRAQIACAQNLLLSRSKNARKFADSLKSWIDQHHTLSKEDLSSLELARAELLWYSKDYKAVEEILHRFVGEKSDAYIRLNSRMLVKKRDPKALQWTEALVEQNPAARNIGAEVYALWSFGKFQDAAELLYRYRQALPLQSWDTLLADIFEDVFATDSVGVDSAIANLVKVGFQNSDELINLSYGLRALGDTRLAVTVCQKAVHRDNFDQLVWMYSCMAELDGPDVALKWLARQIPDIRQRENVAVPAFLRGEDELLWKFVPVNPSEQSKHLVGILRAALVSAPTSNQKAMILNAVQNDRSFDAMLTRYLLNSSDADAIMRTPANRSEICSGCFFVGWSLLRSGKDFKEALLLWRVGQELDSDVAQRAWCEIWSHFVQRGLGYSTVGLMPRSNSVQVVRQEGRKLVGRGFVQTALDSSTTARGRYKLVVRR